MFELYTKQILGFANRVLLVLVGAVLVTLHLVQDNAGKGIPPEHLQGDISSGGKRHDRPGWKVDVHGMKRHGIGVVCVPIDLGFVGLSGGPCFRRFALEIDSSHCRGRFARRRHHQCFEKRRGRKADVCMFGAASERVVQRGGFDQFQNEVAQSVGDEPEFHGIGNFHSGIYGSGGLVFEFALELENNPSFLFGKDSVVPIGIRLCRVCCRPAQKKQSSREEFRFYGNGNLRIQRKGLIVFIE